MSIETKSTHVTPVGGNVFADLGFEPSEAAALQAETKRVITDRLANSPQITPTPEPTTAIGRGD